MNTEFKSLDMTIYYGNIVLTNCQSEYVKCELVGNGYINKLNSPCDIKIVGGGKVYVDDLDLVRNQDISGVGKVILFKKNDEQSETPIMNK